MENLMFKKITTLFRIARRISQSDIINIVSKFQEIPKIVKLFSYILSFSFSKSDTLKNNITNEGEKLCNSIQKMGTTFIKLGQFLSTRPDIIGDEIAKKLEKLQDKLPPFPTNEAKKIIKKELGDNNFSLLLNISEPVVCSISALVNYNERNESRWVRPNSAITNHEGFNFMSICNFNNFVFYGAGICININFWILFKQFSLLCYDTHNFNMIKDIHDE